MGLLQWPYTPSNTQVGHSLLRPILVLDIVFFFVGHTQVFRVSDIESLHLFSSILTARLWGY